MSGRLAPPAEDKSRANALYAEALLSQEGPDSDSQKALAQLRQVAALDPNFEDAQVRIANVLLETGQVESAYDQLRAAAVRAPHSVRVEALLGYTQRLRGHNDEALRLSTRALDKDPSQALSMRVLLEIAADQNNLSDAVDHLEQLLKKEDAPAAAWTTLGRLYREAAQNESPSPPVDVALRTLLPIYQEAVAKGAPDVERLTLLADTYQDLDHKREALKTLEQAVALAPDNVDLLLRCAQLQMDLGEKAAALKNYRLAYNLNPNLNGLRDMLARLYLDNHQFDDAVRVLQDAVANRPKDPELEGDLGAAYEGAHQEALAQECFQRAFASPVCPPDPYLKLAVFQLAAGRIEAADQTLAAARHRFPNSAKVLFYQAIQNRYAKNYPAALACLAAMRHAASPSDGEVFGPDYYLENALTLSLAHLDDGIEPVLREGLAKYPENPDLMNELAYSWADHGKHLPEALALTRRAAQLEPEDGAIQDTWGWVYFKMGKVIDALPYLQRAAVLTNNDPVVLQHVGDAFSKLGRSREALGAWRHALEKDPGNHDLTTRIAAALAPANHAHTRSAPSP